MNFTDDNVKVATPENVDFGYELAGLGTRFIAALIDTFLIIILQIMVFMLMAGLVDLESSQMAEAWTFAILSLVSFGLFWGYYIFFEMTWNGQSPGKRRAGVRVVRLDGTPVTLVESIIRNLVRLVDFLPGFYGIGVVTMFINSQDRRLGDLAAGTVVVLEKEREVTLESLAADASRQRFRAAAADSQMELGGFPLERLEARDIELADDFLRRKSSLLNNPQLAQRILATIFERVGHPFEPLDERDTIHFLQTIAAHRRRPLE